MNEQMPMRMTPDVAFDVSVVIVSLNTERVLRECLECLARESVGLRVETLIVDNGSKDGSVAMIRDEFPGVRLIESRENLGFGRANNLAFEQATGRYIVLLNSDAFLQPDSLRLSVERMDRDLRIGLAGARLVGRDGSWQPSARMFPSLLTDLFVLAGFANKYPRSRIFGRFDRTWADQMVPAEVDWVPGAYSIIRREALNKVGPFDPVFFLYYEEVDLCRRIQAAGYSIWYWPDVIVVHIGGESSRQMTQDAKSAKTLQMSKSGSQLTLWRMRSTLLYYRKNHGWKAHFARLLETVWYGQRALRKRLSSDVNRKASAEADRAHVRLMRQAWAETRGGRTSPPQPW
jgi:GT2 family glycosyltransferase